MKKFLSLVLSSCALATPLCAWSSGPKIMIVDIQRVFENYDKAKAAQAAYGESVTAADKELRGMYEEILKLNDEVKELQAKADNSSLTDSARNKFKNEASAKEEEMRKKDIEFGQLRRDLNDKLSKRRQAEITEQSEKLEKVIAAIAKDKKIDIVLNKFTAGLYVDPAYDMTDQVIKAVNAEK